MEKDADDQDLRIISHKIRYIFLGELDLAFSIDESLEGVFDGLGVIFRSDSMVE